MLVTPRLYRLSQVRDKDLENEVSPRIHAVAGWWHDAAAYREAARMLLVHQSGTLKVGETVR